MKSAQKSEEAELDIFMEKKLPRHIEVPEELEERIQQRISRMHVKKRYTWRRIAACFALLLLISAGIMMTPRFAVYAQNIPVFNLVVKWLYGDSGLKEAAKHGYGVFEPIELEKDGFILQIRDFAFDEERLSVTIAVGGAKVHELFGKASIFADVSFPDLEGYYNNSGTVLFVGSKHKGEAWMVRTHQILFKEGSIKAFLSRKNPDHIDMELSVRVTSVRDEQGNTVYDIKTEQVDFGNIAIPFDRKKFKESKAYDLSGSFEKKHMTVRFEDIVVSPTSMRLVMQAEMEEGYEFEGFRNSDLMDNAGSIIYKWERSEKHYWNPVVGNYNKSGEMSQDKKWSVAYVPSFYFTKKPSALSFLCDGYFISEIKGREFIVNLKEAFPQSFEYMGEKLTISKAWYEKGELRVVLVLPEPFYAIEEMAIADCTKEQDFYMEESIPCEEGQEVRYVFSTEERDSYRIKMLHPLYYIEDEIKAEIKIE